MTCPDENTILRYLAGRLPEDGRLAIDAHLDACPACRKVFSSMALTDHTDSSAGAPPHAATLISHQQPPPDRPNTVSGRYRILAPLGRGGSGQVYSAEHLGTGRRCAIKFLSDEAAADPDAVERFSREARILGELEHRGIVSILDFDEAEDGRPYLVMDHLEGEDLASRLERQGPLRWTEARRLFRQVCRALGAAHAQGVLHRDLKPSNIYLTPDDEGGDRAVLLDFGLAKHHTLPEAPLTRTGAIMGTPAYMSPEQARGRPADERSDVYSLAAVLYQMLTGEPPFRGSTFTEVLAQVLTDPPEPLARHTRHPPPAHLDAVIQIAMAKDPGLRHGSVAELEHRVLDETAPAAAPARPSSRAKAVWLVVGGVAATVLVGIGVFLLQPPPRTASPPHPVASATDAMRAPPTDAMRAPPVAPQPEGQAPRVVPAPGADAGSPARVERQTPPITAAARRSPPMRVRPRARPAQARQRPKPAPRVAAMVPAPRRLPWGAKGDPYISVRGMDGKPKLVRLSHLPAAQRAHIRITAYMSRKDWKTCARIARGAPQTRMILYYSIHCHYMSGDTARTKRLCAQYGKRYPKLVGRIMTCRNVARRWPPPRLSP